MKQVRKSNISYEITVIIEDMGECFLSRRIVAKRGGKTIDAPDMSGVENYLQDVEDWNNLTEGEKRECTQKSDDIRRRITHGLRYRSSLIAKLYEMIEKESSLNHRRAMNELLVYIEKYEYFITAKYRFNNFAEKKEQRSK